MVWSAVSILPLIGSLVKANASLKSMEAVVVEMKPKEYIKRVEKENPVEKPWEPHDDFKHNLLLKYLPTFSSIFSAQHFKTTIF